MNKEEKETKKNSKQKEEKENDEKDLGKEQKNSEEVSKEVKELEKEILRLKELAALLAANSDNERKRHIEESEKIRKYANKQLIKEILPFLDSYNKALEAGEKFQDSKVNDFLLGFQMMEKEL